MLRSPPSRRRGLKWLSWHSATHHRRRLLRGGVDWNAITIQSMNIWAEVASFAEAWIEMIWRCWRTVYRISRLLRGGVDWNYRIRWVNNQCICVASFAEAWIEIARGRCKDGYYIVASFAEAWIEIPSKLTYDSGKKSPPSRRRGLKLTCTRCG